MSQIQGNQSSSSGRIGAELGTAIAAGNVVLGAGWGADATFAIRAGSNDQRGIITVTATEVVTDEVSDLAQATATVAITFADGAYVAVPPYYSVRLLSSTHLAAEPTATAAATCTATVLSWTTGTLPVTGEDYVFAYLVVA